jgi:hypothetical protein
MSDEASLAYSSFLDSVRGVSPQWREAVDIKSLLALTEPERGEAEDLLISRIASDDWRIPPALAAMGSRKSISTLDMHMDKARGKMRLAIARALVSLSALRRIDEAVAEVLWEGEYRSGLAALTAAQGCSSEIVKQALVWAAARHPEPIVRSAAGATLLYVHGIAKEPLAMDFRELYLRLGERSEEDRKRAHEELCMAVGMDPNDIEKPRGAAPEGARS